MTNTPRLLGVVMDPIESIAPKKDSTLAMMLAAQARAWQTVYFEQRDIYVNDGVAYGRGCLLSVTDNERAWHQRGAPWQGELTQLDALLMRKDPPFNTEYIYTTYILELAEKGGLLVVNDPVSLRNINEKASTAWFPDCTPPTLISRSVVMLREFLNTHESVVFKPLDGMGGRSVFVVRKGDINTNVIIETLTDNGARHIMGQRYIPEITDGDKRILLINGKPVDFALARIPAPGDSRGNLVMGARGEGRPLTARDRAICERVGPFLLEKGVMFAGLDVIGEYLTEINVTSPTGIRELDKQFGINIADKLIAAIEERLQR